MNQRERFLSQGVSCDVSTTTSGDYISPITNALWLGFQLGEASGMERAAKVLRDLPHPPEIYGESFVVWEMAIDAAIRALMAQGEI